MIAVVGRPNVGKSSLVNRLVGFKVSIVAPKPQTTRQHVRGVLHVDEDELVFVDTPGLHRARRSALNRYMNDAATSALGDVDLILHVVDAQRQTAEDAAVTARLADTTVPVLLVINKVDRVVPRSALLPLIRDLAARRDYAAVVPVSATRGDNCDALCAELRARLPEGPWLFEPDQVSDRRLDFRVVEAVREKLILLLAQELPYATTVTLESLETEGALLRASAVIWVEREGQKKIVIGEGGQTLKRIGSAARHEIEAQVGQRVFLKLWVRVKRDWTDDPAALKGFGYA
ncbi:MAG TPA: GTPase Era [Nevskiaceae bacterium]